MKLIAVGLNHKTAPIEVRERLASKLSNLGQVYQELKIISSEAALLSTCNRVELYAVPATSPRAIIEWMYSNSKSEIQSIEQHLYVHQEKAALHHLFRVISSLDSMILGEDQIVAQVKSAYRHATEAESTGPILHRVLERAFTVAKKVRTETSISQEGVSIGRAGVDLAKHILGHLSGRKVLLIGAGQHGKLVARHLSTHNLEALYIANRSFPRAERLAQSLQAQAIPLGQVFHYLEHVDIVLTSVGGTQPMITASQLSDIHRRRRYRPLICIDLSVPRAIEPSVSELDNIFCFDIDDLAQVACEGQERRIREAEKAEAIVNVESEQCWHKIHIDELNQKIGTVFKRAHCLQESELEALFHELPELSDEQKEAISRFSGVLVKKILHNPIRHAKDQAEKGKLSSFEEIISAITPKQKEG